MFYGVPVIPQFQSFYAWSPKMNCVAEWIDNYFPNTSPNDFVVYTKDPMRKFLMKKNDILVRCSFGSVVFFVVIGEDMYANWWKNNHTRIIEGVDKGVYSADFIRQMTECLPNFIKG